MITKTSLPAYRLGEHTRYYWREYRWDGRQLRRRERTWGDWEFRPASESRSKEQATYEIGLSKLDCSIQYSGFVDNLQEGLVGYRAFPSDPKVVREDALNNTVFLNRLDLELRDCKDASVRAQTERINGVDCYVLDAQDANGRHTLWIDPNHGYHFARCTRETEGERSVTETVAFQQVDGEWIPVERVFDMRTFMPPGLLEMHIVERVKISEFKIRPDHKALKSFEFDDQIPNGARLFWALPDGRVLTDYIWVDGKPVHKPKE